MTDTFDPKRPCMRRNGSKIVQLVKLERPINGSKEEWMALDEWGEASFNYNDGRVYTVSRDSRDLVNIPEEVEVEMWGIVPNGRDKARAVFASERVAEHYCQPSEVVVPLTGNYTR